MFKLAGGSREEGNLRADQWACEAGCNGMYFRRFLQTRRQRNLAANAVELGEAGTGLAGWGGEGIAWFPGSG